MTLRWRAAGATDVGRLRKGNEDAFLVDEARGVFLVADGMGGHAAGEIASALASEGVGRMLREGVDRGLPPDELAGVMAESFRAADRAISDHVARDPGTSGMGTTLTAAVLQPDGVYRLGHIGDSRAYLMRDRRLLQVTRDHTWVQEQVESGRLTPSQARRHPFAHVLTRALGADSHDMPEMLAGRLEPGDLLLLSTDGLTNMVADRTLGRILRDGGSVEDRVRALIAQANRRGGRDNITAVLVEVLD